MSQPAIAADFEQIQVLAKERATLEELVAISRQHHNLEQEYDDLKSISDEGTDAELVQMAREELGGISSSLDELAETLKIALLPKDPNDERDVIVEVRSGAGGQEASLFAADLYRLYTRYAQLHNWQVDVMDSNPSDLGGFNKIVLEIKGKGAFSRLKYERGVHRVQRIPETESSGRIHTSAATVAVLPEAEDVDIEINESDLKIDTYRASGAGGQHVNKTESAIRITHNPTGQVVTCQDESSQHKNRDKAMKVLRSRLYEVKIEKQNKERADVRKSMVSTGDRSAKIRTYNFPQGRVTDHRINLTLYKLNEIMDGDLTAVIEALRLEDQKAAMEAV